MATGSPVVRNIIIVIAMEQEAMPIVEKFHLRRCIPTPFLTGAPFVTWVGEVGSITLRVVWCGRDPRFGGVNNVATTAAAVATYASFVAFGAPELLISAGTAGGFKVAGACVGDVFLSSKCVFHARRIPSDEGSQNFEEYGFGHFRSPPLGALVVRAGLKLGVVSTSDSLDSSAIDLELMRSEGAAVKEMEAASVAWVCQAIGVPFVALKAITDIVDGTHATRGEFESNLHMASSNLQHKVALVLELLGNTTLKQWASGGTADMAPLNHQQTPETGADDRKPPPLDTTMSSTTTRPIAPLSFPPPAPPSAISSMSLVAGLTAALVVGLVAGVWGSRLPSLQTAVAR